MKRSILIGLLAIAAAIAASIAYGAIPSANGTISACYDRQSGQMRIYDSATNLPKGCGPREAPISWNVQGPAGQAGADGQDGQDGVSGFERVADNTQASSDDQKSVATHCSPGKKVVGGGGFVIGDFVGTPAPAEVALFYTGPDGNGWEVKAHEAAPTDADWLLVAIAICVTAS